jgi:pyridoxamine 5'-phosphate oxidase
VCVLATATAGGAPSARAVLLKHADEHGFAFVTDARSRKAADLAANAQAALVFVWSHARRQVRVEGVVEAVADHDVDAWWAARPLDSRYATIASCQDATVDSRRDLEAALARVRASAGDDPLRPAHFIGRRVRPRRIEFWQSAYARLHDRFVYVNDTGEWRIARLQP